MNRLVRYLPLAIGAALILFLTFGCLGSKATPKALFPPAELAWPAVQEDYERGLDDGVEDGDIDIPAGDVLRAEGDRLGVALHQRDLDELRTVSWTSMQPWAERGIADKLEDQEIGPGVAESLREQLRKFTTTINRLQASF